MAGRARSRISAKHALTSDEVDFCKIYVAFGSTNHTEAYRRAFLKRRITDHAYVEAWEVGLDPELIARLPEINPKEVSRRAKGLLKQDYIAAYLDEIIRPPGDHARGVLADQARFGDKGDARRAAEQILQQEDKLGMKDAVERWAEILCEVGATIEVPLPYECPHCGKGLYGEAPMSEMFKKEEE